MPASHGLKTSYTSQVRRRPPPDLLSLHVALPRRLPAPPASTTALSQNNNEESLAGLQPEESWPQQARRGYSARSPAPFTRCRPNMVLYWPPGLSSPANAKSGGAGSVCVCSDRRLCNSPTSAAAAFPGPTPQWLLQVASHWCLCSAAAARDGSVETGGQLEA